MQGANNVVLTPDVFSPLMVDSVDSVAWDDSADVVVVGFGAAGAAAALEARECNQACDVMIVDRFDGGGATALSGGIFYAGGTRYQREAGFDDNADEMYKYLRLEVGDAVSDETLRRFCDSSNDNVEWLESHGIRFGSTLYEGKTTYPPEGKFLYYSGNEKVAKYTAHAKAAPRGLRTWGRGFTGSVFFAALRDAALRAGIRLMQHAPVRRLVIDQSGAVIGLETSVVPANDIARHQSLYKRVSPLRPFQNARAEQAIADCQTFENQLTERRLIRARSGVTLATGGFIYNVPMLKQFVRPSLSDNYGAMVRTGSMGCSGAGIRLGLSVGAATGKMSNILAGRSISPPSALLEGMLVGRAGRRFINEDSYLGFVGDAIAQQADGQAWMILDRRAFKNTLLEILPNGDGSFLLLKLPALLNILFGGTHRADSIASLATKCGIDANALGAEFASYNEIANAGSDSLGKGGQYLRALEDGRCYAINMSLSNPLATTVSLTLGGLKVNEANGAVLRPDGSDITGLHAAGRVAVGVCSNGYFSGMALADCVFSGRRAGRCLAGG